LSAPSLDAETAYSIGVDVPANSDLKNFVETWISEPNDSEAASAKIDYQTSKNGYLHVGDIDFYDFTYEFAK